MYDDLDDLPRDCEVPFENMSEDVYIYRLMNPEDPLYMCLIISLGEYRCSTRRVPRNESVKIVS